MALFKGDNAIKIAIEGIKRLIEHDRSMAKAEAQGGAGASEAFPVSKVSSSPSTPDVDGQSRKKMRKS